MRTTITFILTTFFIGNLISQTIFPFRQGEKWFFVNASFKPISTKTYSFVFPFKGQRAIVRQGDKYGVVDEKEKIIIPCTHDTIEYGSTFFFCIDKNVETCYDKNGYLFDHLLGLCGGSYGRAMTFYTYTKNNKIGLIVYNNSHTKSDTLPNIYSEINEVEPNVGFAKLGDKWGVINSKGKIITNFTLDSIHVTETFDHSQYTLHKYYLSNTIGLINVHGKVVTPAKYKDSFFIYDKFTLVKTLDNQFGYIDHTGREYFK